MTYHNIKKSFNFKKDYALEKSKLIDKEREREALQNSLSKEQKSSLKYIEENNNLVNQIAQIEKQIQYSNPFHIEVTAQTNISNVYYKLHCENQIHTATMLKEKEYLFIMTLFPFWKIRLKILFKASVDGDTVRSFRMNCQMIKKQLLVVIRLENDNIIGAYTSKPNWDMKYYDEMINDDNSFLFNINNQRKFPLQSNMKGMVIEDHRFRYDNDLIIYDGYLHGLKVKSAFNDSPPNMDRLSFNSLTNGLSDFHIKDIEAYEVIITQEFTDELFIKISN